MVYEIAHFGYNSARVCILILGSFLHPYENHLPKTSILRTRIIAALPLLDVIKTRQRGHNRI